MDGEAKTSINSMIDALKSQVEYMDAYAENIQKAMEMGVDEGLIRKLSDGKEESAQLLAAIVQGGEEDIEALNEEFRKVEKGKTDFTRTVAELETDFSNEMEKLKQDLNKTIQEMDVQEEARTVGGNNIQGLINGTVSKAGALTAAYAKMGRDALAAYKREVDQHSPSRKFYQAGSYDIQGIIQGAEAEKPKLAAAYEEAAQAALSGMERHLPSTVIEPPASAAINRQTDAIVAAVAGRESSGASNPIYIDKLVVRDDSDIRRIAQELYYLTEREGRSKGGRL